MNVQTMKASSRWMARRKFNEYREAVNAGRGSREDKILMNGYRQLAMGRQLINVFDAIRDAGVKSWQNEPRLAICRADQKKCIYRCLDYGRIPTFVAQGHIGTKSLTVELPARSLPPTAGSNWFSCLVPAIPPALRPKAALHNYHILWEADWTKPPVDPMLLRHVDGPFYVVLATWDLTELEQSVLSLNL